MTSETVYLRNKKYRQEHSDKVKATHDKWVAEHREQWNAYQREYRQRIKIGLPGGKKAWAQMKESGVIWDGDE